jgi:hypothetical protein
VCDVTAPQLSLALPEPDTWQRPKGKNACGRNPDAGPGTCWHWWDGCPRAEQRGCYQLWRGRQAEEKSDA